MRGGALSRSLGPGAPAQRRVSGVLPRAAGASPGDRRGAWKETETRSTAAGTQAALRAPPAPHRVPAARRGGPRRDAPEGPTCAVGDGCENANKRSEGARPDRIRSRSQSADGSEGACRPEDLRRSVLGGVLEASVCPPCLPVLPSPYCFL